MKGADVKLSWKAISIATRYEIYRHTKDESKSALKIKALSVSTDTSYTDSPGVGTFYYWLKVCNSYGCSDFSKSVSFILTKTAVEKPTEPTKLTASLDVSSKAILSWQAVPTATSYEIYLGKLTDPRAADWQAETTSGVTTHTQEIKAGTFYYWLKACNSSGCSGYSQKVTLIKLAAPTILSPASATVTNSQISLSWRDVSGVTKYEIYRGASTNPSEATKIVRSSTKTSYTGSIDPGTFHYWLKACNSYGCSDFSTRIARTKEATKEPTAPTELTASLNDSSKAILSWNAIATAKWYKIHRNIKDQSSGAPEITPSDNKLTANSYTESIAADTYFYWVQACNDYGCSGYSKTASLTKLAAPTTLSAIVEDSKASLSWEAVTGVTKYQIYRNDTEDKSSDAPEITSSSLVVTDNNYKESIDAGTYFYWVKACNDDGCSDHSKSDRLTKLAAPELTASLNDESKAILSWEAVPNVTKYEIYSHTKDELSTAINIASPTNNNDYTTTTIVAGKFYYYWLKVCNSDGCSDSSTVVRLIKPYTPTLTAEVQDSKASFSWSPRTNFASYYEIYWGSSSSNLTRKTADISGDLRSYTEEINAGTFYYGIKACNSYGCSDLSTVVSLTKLAAPRLTASSLNDDSKASLSWEVVTDAEKYRVYRDTEDQSLDAPEITSSDNGVTGINYTDPTALVAGTPYYYWLKACNDDGCSDHSETASLTKLTAPTLTASLDDESKASFSWSAIDNATGYAIYRHTTNEPSKAQKITADSVTGITHTASIAAGTFYYWLRACNSDGCSDYSQSVSLTKLSAPTTLSAKVEDSQASFSWSIISGATKYEIHKGASTKPSEATKIDRPSTQDTETSYTEEIAEGTFRYWLKACNNAGCSDVSDVITLTKAPLTKPTVPTDITAKVKGSRVSLSWKGIFTATHYKIHRYTEDRSSDASEITPSDNKLTVTSYTDVVINFDTYFYWVEACNSKGCSDYSDAISLTNLSAPGELSAKVEDSKASLSWNAITGANKYRIYKNTTDQSSDAPEITSLDNVVKDISYTDASIDVDTYFYWVKACNDDGCSDHSETASLTKLAAPTKLTANLNDKLKASLSWEVVTDANKYRIYKNTKDESLDAPEITSLDNVVTDISYTDASIVAGPNFYWLQACNDDGCSDYSQSVSLTKLAAPTKLTANLNDKLKASLSWEVVTDANKYRIYKNTKDESLDALEITSSDNELRATSYTDASIAAGPNFYWVQACNDDGCSDYSKTASLTKLTAPELTANLNDESKASLSWDAITGADKYRIYRDTEDQSLDAPEITSLDNVVIDTNYTDASIAVGTYYYWLQACNDDGCSDHSNTASLTKLATPTKLTASLNDESKAILSWVAVPNVTKYEIYRHTKEESSTAIRIASPTNNDDYTDTGTTIDAGKLYYYWLKVCNSDGCSDFSAVVRIGKLATPTLSASLSASLNDESQASFSWGAITHATKYKIYRHTSNDLAEATEITSDSEVTGITHTASIAAGTFFYWLEACDGYGCSSPSVAVSLTKLAAPKITVSTDRLSYIVIAWKHILTAKRYRIYRRDDSVSSPALSSLGGLILGDEPEENHTYTDLAEAGTYSYWARACVSVSEDESGCSDYSAVASLTKPEVPKILTKGITDTSSDSKARFTWSVIANATKYEVYRNGSESYAPWHAEKIADISTDTNVTAYTEVIPAGKLVHYWVRACTSSACSDFSYFVSLVNIAVPKNLTASLAGSAASLSWDAVSDATGYEIYRNKTGVKPSTAEEKIGDSLAATTSYTDSTIVGTYYSGTYYYWVKTCTSSECSDFSKVASVERFLSLVNDTGIDWSGRYLSGNNSDCSSNTNIDALQDCNQGRDAQAAAGTLTKIGDGSAGFDFTKLGASGDALTTQNGTWSDTGNEASGTLWSCVRDNFTGLVWEVKVATGSADTSNNIHHKDNTYRWGGITAIGRGHASRQGSYYEDWNTLVTGSNDASLCGYSDWRAPEIGELKSIVDYGKSSPRSIDTRYFPNTVSAGFWSASPHVFINYVALSVYFDGGHDYYNYRYNALRLRLVRGGQ